LLLFVAGMAAAQERPDLRKTPEVINPDGASANLVTAICDLKVGTLSIDIAI
jgi:hypothetical protein